MKNTFKIIMFTLIVLVMFISLNKLVLPKDRNYKLRSEFFKLEPNSLDALVVGSCHSYTAINPKIIEKKTHIATYDYSLPSSSLEISYLSLIDILKTQKPKIVFVESWGINIGDTYIGNKKLYNYFVASMSAFPFSKEKNEIINDFFNNELNPLINKLKFNEEKISKEKQALIFPFSRYKTRFFAKKDGLEEIDFNDNIHGTNDYFLTEIPGRIKNNGYLKNVGKFESRPDLIMPIDYKMDESNKMKEISDYDQKYINKIIDLSIVNNFKVVFFRSPYLSKRSEIERTNYLENVLEKENIEFINLEKEIQFNNEIDFFDNAHLNEVGANKASLFIADYLEKNMN